MKKFLAIIAIASFAVACNNSGEKKPAEDTTAPAVVDTAAPAVVDTAAPAVVDTTKPAAADTTKK